jgi:hypothetical protein
MSKRELRAQLQDEVVEHNQTLRDHARTLRELNDAIREVNVILAANARLAIALQRYHDRFGCIPEE